MPVILTGDEILQLFYRSRELSRLRCHGYSLLLGLSIKDVRNKGRFVQCGRLHFLVQKTSDFSKIYGVSARIKERVKFVRTSFMDSPFI